MARKKKKKFKKPTPPGPVSPPPGQEKPRPEKKWATKKKSKLASLPGLIPLLLIIVVFFSYAEVRDHDFVQFDDDVYVTANPYVSVGLDTEGFRWALTTGHGSNWHPLTWISLMLDRSLFGLDPGAFHRTNLIFHLLNVVLLYLLLFKMTGKQWAAAMVAALFGLHPLHVESVAWVAERKDVLSTFFWLLTTLAYVRYVQKDSKVAYRWALVFLGLGLMSKPMLVTLPFTLLLLDFWPLNRVSSEQLRTSLVTLAREKIPFFALVVLSSAATYFVQHRGGAVGTFEQFPLGTRMANAVMAYAGYIMKTVWPTDLTFFYPYSPERLTWLTVGVAAVCLLGITLFFICRRNREPWLVTGWFWYLGTLVPVIGLIQVGEQSMADRYTYIPHIGLFIIVVFLVDAGLSRVRSRALVAGVLAAVVLLPLAKMTRAQVGVWKNDVTLCEHALAIDESNFKAHNNLGIMKERRGDLEGALEHFQRALATKPHHERHYNLGNTYRKLGKEKEAVAAYMASLEMNPGFAKAYNNLGAVFFNKDDFTKAAEYYRKAVEAEPKVADYYNNLGATFLRLNKNNQAFELFSEAVRLDPRHQGARRNLELVKRQL